MWMVPEVPILVTDREFNTSVDCPDLPSNYREYFLTNTELSYKWTLMRKGFYFKHPKISARPTPNLFQSECSLHTLTECISLNCTARAAVTLHLLTCYEGEITFC